MAFKKMDLQKFPPRQWALVGYPTAGKSTFATQMRGPLLLIDADHRFVEVARHALAAPLELSSRPADNVDARRIATLLRENMPTSEIGTIVVDSLTAIISPLVAEAFLGADEAKNKVVGYGAKAMTMRLLQDSITGWGVDALWIYHLRERRDDKAKLGEATSISLVELVRLRRSINMQLRVVQDGNRRGVTVDWSHMGRSGMTLWDDSDHWRGMPERIEQAVYGGLTVEDMERIAGSQPTSFANATDAIAWGFAQGCFRDAVHAKNAYDKLKADAKTATATAMWQAWIQDVRRRQLEGDKVPA